MKNKKTCKKSTSTSYIYMYSSTAYLYNILKEYLHGLLEGKYTG